MGWILIIAIDCFRAAGIESSITTVGSCSHIGSLEHVAVYITVEHKYKGDLQFDLISPSGVESVLAQPHLDGHANFVEWKVTKHQNLFET